MPLTLAVTPLWKTAKWIGRFWSYASVMQITVIKYTAKLVNCTQFAKVLPTEVASFAPTEGDLETGPEYTSSGISTSSKDWLCPSGRKLSAFVFVHVIRLPLFRSPVALRESERWIYAWSFQGSQDQRFTKEKADNTVHSALPKKNQMHIKSDRERQMPYDITYMCNQKKKNDTNELIYETEIDSQMWKTDLWLPKRKSGG